MNRRQKFLIHFMAITFTSFIMVFSMNSWCLIRAFQGFFEAGQNIELTAFVYDGVSEDSILDFIKKYQASPQVSEIKRQTAEQSFQALKSELKIFDFQLGGVELEKILPQVLTIKLKNLDENLIAEIKANKVVDELMDGRHWLQKNESIIGVLKGAGLFAFSLCAASLVLSMVLLLKTQLQFEREEINLRAMHGEDLWSLRKTYVIKGLLISAAGAVIGIISTHVGSSVLKNKILTQFQIQTLADNVNPLTIGNSLSVLILASLLGAFVAYLQTSSFEKEFYLQK